MRSTAVVAAVSGVTFAVLYLVAFGIADLPEGAYSDARVMELYANTSSRTAIIVSAVLLGLAGLALLPFLAHLRSRLRPAGIAADVAFGAGLLYVAALFGAANLQGGYAIGVALGELPQPVNAELARVLTNQGFGLLLLYGLFAAAALVFATSLAARTTGAVSRPIARAGFLVTPLLLAGAAWVPQLLVPLWVVAVSWHVTRERAHERPVVRHSNRREPSDGTRTPAGYLGR
jgi:hypothetical protein